jgi:predicted dehydrogenase
VAYEPWQFRSVDLNYEKQVQEFLAERKYKFEPASHRKLVKDFMNAIWEKRQPTVDTREIRRSLQVLTAIYKSNRLGKRIELPIEKDDAFYSNLNPK